MSIITITRFHAVPEGEDALLELQMEGRRRMLSAQGCEAFHILRDEADSQCFVFVQRWVSRDAHDAAFGERILATGHLEKVLSMLDEPVTQNIYEIAS
jgi:quinol monooxygenase YgiN